MQVSETQIDNPEPNISYRSSRLNAIGLVDIKTADVMSTVGTIKTGRFVTISEFGKQLIKYGLPVNHEAGSD